MKVMDYLNKASYFILIFASNMTKTYISYEYTEYNVHVYYSPGLK